MVLSSSCPLGSVCLALDQFLAVLANLPRPFFRVVLLLVSHSRQLIGMFTWVLASGLLFACVLFSPSFTTISITHASWLLSLSSLRGVVSSRHSAARRFLGCLGLRNFLGACVRMGLYCCGSCLTTALLTFYSAGYCVYVGALSCVCAGFFRPPPEVA